MMKKEFKRIFAVLLCTVMVLGTVPTGSFLGIGGFRNPFVVWANAADAKTYKFGDIIEFGTYPQSEVTDTDLSAVLSEMQPDENGDISLEGIKYRFFASKWYVFEPIRWKVLSADGSGYYLLAEKIIDCLPYHDRDENITWEMCSLRTWLNDSFYGISFSEAEKKQILLSDVVNDDVPGYSTYSGNDTKDHVYLLSYNEACSSEYGFKSASRNDSKRYASPTDYTTAKGIRTSTQSGFGAVGAWWLRSAGKKQNQASDCSRPGSLNYQFTCVVNEMDMGIRPVMRIAAIPANSAGQIEIRVCEEETINPYTGTIVQLTGLSDGVEYSGFVTEKSTVTFSDLNKNQAYSARLVSQNGVEYGKIAAIQFGNADTAFGTFSNLKPRLTQSITVQAADGTLVSDGFTVNWSFADAGTFLCAGNSVSDVTVGTKLSCEILLSDELLRIYRAPSRQVFNVSEDNLNKTVRLSAIPKIQITGTVTDDAGDPIANAAVGFVQTVSNRVSINMTENTDGNGSFSAEIADLPAEVTVSKFGYTARTMTKSFVNGEHASFTLDYISGARFKLQIDGTNNDGTRVTFGADNNLTYTVRNETAGRNITDYSIQYPQLLIPDSEISAGDTIVFSAADKSGEYVPASANVVYDAQAENPAVSLQLVQKGMVRLTAAAVQNEKNMAVLFHADGQFVCTADFNGMLAESESLSAGTYTVVLCGRSPIMYCLNSLSNMESFNLVEGTDYVRLSAAVADGEITELTGFSIPTLDEDKFTLVSASESSLSVAQAEVSLGQYVSVRASMELTEKYKAAVSGTVMHIAVPENCALVPGSVTVDAVTIENAKLQNGVLSVPLPATCGTVRFYLRPTVGDETYNIFAYASLTIGGNAVEQPVGSTRFSVSRIKLSAPTVTTEKTITVTGKTVAYSTVDFFDNNVSVGSATANAAGSFSAQFTLYRPSSDVTHSIYAVVTTPEGYKYESDNITVVYDAGAVKVSKVLMRNKGDSHTRTFNHWQTTVFDFENPSSKTPSYRFWAARYPTVSFEVIFTRTDPSLVKNVYVVTTGSNGEVIYVPVTYNASSESWKGSYDYDDYTAPCQVDVAFTAVDGSEKSGVSHAPGANITVQDYNYTPKADTTVYTDPTDDTPFALTEVYPDKGSDGKVTLRLTGTMLEANAEVVLTNGAKTVKANEVFYMNHQRAYATFDLSAAPNGKYDLVIACGDKQTTLKNCFTLDSTLPHGKLEKTLQISEKLITGETHTGSVVVRNTGYTDVYAPTLTVYGQNILLAQSASSEYQSGIRFLCAKSYGLAGILMHGEEAGMQFSYLAPENGSFEVIIKNHNAANDALYDDRPIESNASPIEIVEKNRYDYWGYTSAEYYDHVAQMACYLSQFRSDVRASEDAVMPMIGGYIFGKTFLKATDLSAMDLSVDRSFAADIINRSENGMFGLGWSTEYEQTASYISDGDDEGIVVSTRSGDVIYIKENDAFIEPFFGLSSARYENGSIIVTEKNGVTYTYNASGKLASVRDIEGNGITMQFDGNRLTGMTSTDGDSISFTYEDDKIVSAVSLTTGDRAEYAYNGEYLSSVTTKYGTTAYTYDTDSVGAKRNTLTSVQFPDGTKQYFRYDTFGRLIKQYYNDDQESVSYRYGAYNDVTVTDADGTEAHIFYDENGNAVRTISGDGNVICYDYKTGTSTPVKIRYGDTFAVQYRYNDRMDLIQAIDAAGESVRYTYDAMGNITSITDQSGNTMTYTRNSLGQLTKLIYPDESFERYTYDSKGNTQTYTNRKGETTTLTYDAFSNLTRVDYADGTATQYTYDARGNVTRITQGSTTTTAAYNANGDLTSVTYPGGKTIAYTYDAFGRTASITDSAGVVTRYVYDSLGRLQKLTDADGAAISTYTYTTGGNLARQDNANGTYTVYAYENGYLKSIHNMASDDSTMSSFAYTYDSRGLVQTMTDNDGVWHYTYDKIGQLITSTSPSGHVTQYVYDLSGNRVAVTADGAETTYTSNSLNQYTRIGNTVLTYDANGNLVSRTDAAGTVNYLYDCLDRLVKVTSPDGVTEYSYDAFGGRNRVTRNGSTTEYVNDPTGYGNVLTSYTGSKTASYIQGDGLIAQIGGGQTYFYHYNRLGSTSEITGANGMAVNTYRYDQEGTVTAQTGTLVNPFTYVGQYGIMDDENGLWYMRARYVSKETDSFITVDPIRQKSDNNVYAYAGRNLINYFDLTGESIRSSINSRANNVALGVSSLLLGPISPAIGTALGIFGILDSLLGDNGESSDAQKTEQMRKGDKGPWYDDLDPEKKYPIDDQNEIQYVFVADLYCQIIIDHCCEICGAHVRYERKEKYVRSELIDQESYGKYVRTLHTKEYLNNPVKILWRDANCGQHNKPVPEPNEPGGTGGGAVTPIHDPSGFVCEAVASNRLDGVTATCYYSAYPDGRNAVVWNAEEYDQVNPLVTDGEGGYEWYVPDGWWQVRYEKDGYVTAYSAWLPVPPAQTEVNISLDTMASPKVEYVQWTEHGIEMQFSRYMEIDSVNAETVRLSQNDTLLRGKLYPVDAEPSFNDPNVSYATKFVFVPYNCFPTGNVTVHIHGARNYVGTPMDEAYTAVLQPCENVPSFAVEGNAALSVGETATLHLRLPTAAAGRQIRVKGFDPNVLSVSSETLTVAADGTAALHVTALQNGIASIQFALADSNAYAETQIVIGGNIQTVSAVLPGIENGMALIEGTRLPLLCNTDGATIYYATDGSDPADSANENRAVYAEPITPADGMTIRACAVKDGMASSETATFRYTVYPNIPAEDFALDRESAVLIPGQSITLTAAFTPEDATNQRFTYTTGDSGIASITPSGVLTASGCGETQITAAAEDFNEPQTVHVRVLAGITLSEGTAYTQIGDMFTVADEETAEQTVRQKFRNDGLELVTDNAEAKAAGRVGTGAQLVIRDENGGVLDSVTAVVRGDLDGSGTVTIRDLQLLAQAIDGKVTLTAVQIAAADYNADGSVNKNDLYAIKARLLASDQTFTAMNRTRRYTANLAVEEVKAVNVHRFPVRVTLTGGADITTLRFALNFDPTAVLAVNCSINNGTVQSKVHAEDGRIIVLAENPDGLDENTTITVFFKPLRQNYGSYNLSLTGNLYDALDANGNMLPVTMYTGKIDLNDFVITGEKTRIQIAESLQLTSALRLNDAEKGEVTWSSSSPSIATVSQDGKVTGKSFGTATITAALRDGTKAFYNVTVLSGNPELRILSYDGVFEKQVNWWRKYSTAGMQLYFKPYNCENVVRYEWSSDSLRVHVDENGNITNTGCFARSAKITLTAYDAEGNVAASSTVTVRFYKFRWQYNRLRTQEVVSDNVFRSTVEPTETEPETLISFVTALLTKAFRLIIR